MGFILGKNKICSPASFFADLFNNTQVKWVQTNQAE